MRNWKTLLIASTAALLSAVLAIQAQVPGVNSTLNSVFTLAYDNSTMKQSFSASNVVTIASSPSDVCVLQGSATKNVRVRRVILSGNATAVGSVTVAIEKRSTAPTGGTVATPTIGPHDSSNAAGTAVMETFTANPTTLGTGVAILAEQFVFFGNLTTGVANGIKEFTFGQLAQPVVLRGVAQGVAVHLGGVTVAGGVLACTFEWTEE